MYNTYWQAVASLRLREYPVCLGPLPKRRKLHGRSAASRKPFPMLDQHFWEIHSISGDAVWVRAPFEQMQRIRVRFAMIESHRRAIEQ